MSDARAWQFVTGDWHRPRRGRGLARSAPAGLLLLCAASATAMETPGKPRLQQNSLYLSSAGFRVQFANNPELQSKLHALPAHRFVVEGTGDAARYLYAEPQHCVCIFVGTRQAYDSYQQMVTQPPKPSNNAAPDYKTQAGMLLSNQVPRQSTRADPTTLSDYLSTLSPRY